MIQYNNSGIILFNNLEVQLMWAYEIKLVCYLSCSYQLLCQLSMCVMNFHYFEKLGKQKNSDCKVISDLDDRVWVKCET